jgi:hypothetical protein
LDTLSDRQLLSLDIFDTCLIRALSKPDDIFRLLGAENESLTGVSDETFAVLRKSSENTIRQRVIKETSREDVSLDEIYAELGKELDLNTQEVESLKQAEIRIERRFIRPVEAARQLAWGWIEKGKPLVYVSEMYLPVDVLRDLLDVCGFPVEEIPIYASGAMGLSKGSGNLFRECLSAENNITTVHIGDNPVSDVEMAKQAGMDARLVQAGKACYDDILSNVLKSILSRKETGIHSRKKFWTSFGFEVAGPIHFAFASYLYRHCDTNNVKRLFFLSRDGWFPMQVFQRVRKAWGNPVETQYVHASREMLGIACMTEIGEEEWDFILKPSPLLNTGDVFRRLGIQREFYLPILSRFDLPDENKAICHHWGFIDPQIKDQLYHAICFILPEFLEERAKRRESVLRYLNSLDFFEGDSTFVDIGWSGSSQKAINQLTPVGKSSPRGIYFALLGEIPENSSDWFTSVERRDQAQQLLKGSVALMEFLFGSPDPTVKSLSYERNELQCSYRKPWPLVNLEAWKDMLEGINAFTDTMLRLFPAPVPGNGKAYIADLISDWIYRPDTEMLNNFAPLVHGEGWGTDHRLTVLPKLDLLQTREQVFEALCYSPWKPGLVARSRYKLEPFAYLDSTTF